MNVFIIRVTMDICEDVPYYLAGHESAIFTCDENVSNAMVFYSRQYAEKIRNEIATDVLDLFEVIPHNIQVPKILNVDI